jgi:hypothetical protein
LLLPFLQAIFLLTFYFFQFNRYVLLHGNGHISAYKPNPEPPTAMLLSPEYGEAATKSAGKKPPPWFLPAIHMAKVLLFFSNSIDMAPSTERTYLDPQTQSQTTDANQTLATGLRAVTASAGKNLILPFLRAIPIANVFYYFSIQSIRPTPREQTYLSPQTQHQTSDVNTTFTIE